MATVKINGGQEQIDQIIDLLGKRCLCPADIGYARDSFLPPGHYCIDLGNCRKCWHKALNPEVETE